MKTLAELPKLCVLRHGPPENYSYWCGGKDWVKGDTVQFGVVMLSREKLAYLANNNGVYAGNTIVDVDFVHSLFLFEGKWVITNRETQTFNEVVFQLPYGAGYFIKDMGTTPQVLVINQSAKVAWEVHFRGNKIEKVIQIIGLEREEVTYLTIPDNSDVMKFFHIGKPMLGTGE